MKKQRLLFIFFSAVLLLCCSVALASSATISLPATGQTKCYDSSGAVIACTGTGQDGDKQTGLAWPNPRFTASGNCVTDNLTGLMWAKNATLMNSAGTSWLTMEWQQAIDYVASLNASGGLCGYTDWRLPQVLELESLIHRGYVTCDARDNCTNVGEWLNKQGFNGVQYYGIAYWSSTTSAESPKYMAWVVQFYFGEVYTTGKVNYPNLVWPVRGGQ